MRLAVRVGEITQRPLHFADQVGEHGLQCRQDRFQLRRRLGRVPLEMLGLGEGEFQLFRQGAREVIAAERDRPLPDDAIGVGDDEVAAIGADVEGDDAVRFLLLLVVGPRSLAEHVVGDEIA